MKGDENFARNNARARKLAVLFCYRSLLITYAIIISEKINRAVIALLGAALMVIMGLLIYTMPLRNILNGDDYTTHRYDDFGEHYE